MDNQTLRILRILERDARVPADDIATMVDMQVDEVHRIIRDCEAQKLIRSYRTVVDWERAGDESVTAMIDVRVSPAREVGFDDVAARIYRFPEVESVYLVSGGYDLHVVVKGPTMKDVALFVAEKLATLDRVISTATHFLLRTYKEAASSSSSRRKTEGSALLRKPDLYGNRTGHKDPRYGCQ